MCWDFICIINNKNIIRSSTHHSGQTVVWQEGTQIVISNPAILPTALRKMVEEHVQNLVTYVVICTIEQEPQETVEMTNSI